MFWSCPLGSLSHGPPWRYKISYHLCPTWGQLVPDKSNLQMAAICAGLRGALERPNCEPRPAATSASPGATQHSVWGTQKPGAACSVDFRKIWTMSQERLFMWKSHWKWLGWAKKLCGPGYQGITRTGWTVLARLMKTQMGCPHVGSVWKSSGEEQWLLLILLSGEKALLHSLPPNQTIQFLPVCPRDLLICCHSVRAQREWVRVSLRAWAL